MTTSSTSRVELVTLGKIMNMVLAERDLSLLIHIERAPTIRELSELMGITENAAYAHVSGLEHRGLVARASAQYTVTGAPRGRKRQRFELTDKGHAIMARGPDLLRRIRALLENENTSTPEDVRGLLGRLLRSEPLTRVEAMRLEDLGYCTVYPDGQVLIAKITPGGRAVALGATHGPPPGARSESIIKLR